MRRDLASGGSIGVQQAGGSAMCYIPPIATDRLFDSVAYDRVNEPQRVVLC
jgi:hypothetical protein